MISINNVSILVLCYLFMYYGIFVSYKLNEMLDFLKENMISIYNKYQELITNNCVINTCAFQQFSNYSI